MSKMNFMNIKIDNVTLKEAIIEIKNLIVYNNNAYVVTPNVDHIVKIEKDKEFKMIYDAADMVLTDGKPLVWISKLYKNPIKEKISGSDLFPRICEMAADNGYKMYFLGATEGVARKAADNLILKYPKLQVVGTYSPPFGYEKDEKEVEKIISLINTEKPEILIVGLGTPKQEKFMYKYRTRIGVPISLGLGASFDFEAGVLRRAPRFMSEHGLEWLYRLCQEPKRMFKRYIIDDMYIIKLIWKYRKIAEDKKETV